MKKRPSRSDRWSRTALTAHLELIAMTLAGRTPQVSRSQGEPLELVVQSEADDTAAVSGERGD